MILYNVTINVEDLIHDDWFNWLTNHHIPKMYDTGLFIEHKILRLIPNEEDNTGTTYAVQYYLKDIQDFLKYYNNYAELLQEESKAKFGDQAVAFRTLLEVIQ